MLLGYTSHYYPIIHNGLTAPASVAVFGTTAPSNVTAHEVSPSTPDLAASQQGSLVFWNSFFSLKSGRYLGYDPTSATFSILRYLVTVR